MLLQEIRSSSPLGILPLCVSLSSVQLPNSFDQCMVTGTRSSGPDVASDPTSAAGT